MKKGILKRILVFVLVFSMLGTTGCSSEIIETIKKEIASLNEYQLELTEEEIQHKNELQEAGIYPYYNSLSEKEKEIYLRICSGIERYEKEQIVLAKYDTEKECEAAEERLGIIYQYLLYEQPQYFWAHLTKYEYVMLTYGEEYLLGIKLKYIMEKEEAETKKEALNTQVDGILAAAQTHGDTYNQVLYVYDTILQNTVYDHAVADGEAENDLGRSVYGCLVEKKTVCSGYTMAFTLILQKLGYLVGSAFDNVNVNDRGDGHVWNYARLDDAYYHFDLTWDDTSFESEDYAPYFAYGHQYFGITDAELPHTISRNGYVPVCSGTIYNYFMYNGLNMSTYDFATAKTILKKQAGQKWAVIRFDTKEAMEQTKQELIDQERFYQIFPSVRRLKYLMADSNLHLYIMW